MPIRDCEAFPLDYNVWMTYNVVENSIDYTIHRNPVLTCRCRVAEAYRENHGRLSHYFTFSFFEPLQLTIRVIKFD